MAGLNKVTIIGNLGRDPEMRYTPSGSPVTSFSVAVSRNWKSRDGEAREETEWFFVECWDKLAELTNEYLSKGRQVYLEGRQKTDTWDDKQTGEKRYRTKLVANEMVLLGSRADRESGGEAPVGDSSADRGEFESMPF
ncbi:MAG: single-stranded DNA-binding protein [Chloroflexota bacterium]